MTVSTLFWLKGVKYEIPFVLEILCQNCGKVFHSKYKHSIHQKDCIERSGQPLQCIVCSKFFSTSKLLERHRRIVHGEKKHICEHCGKSRVFQSHFPHKIT